MAMPRFLFVVLSGSPDPAGVAVPSQSRSSEGSYGWRLLGSNNRELGRSAASLVSVAAAAADVVSVTEHLASFDLTDVRGSSNGGWTWALTGPTGAVARSARAYHRERECRYSAEQFLAAVPTAGWAVPEEGAALPIVSARAFASQSLLVHSPVRALR